MIWLYVVFGYKRYLWNLFCLEGMRRNLSQHSQQPSQETTQTSPKYKSTVLKLHQAILWKVYSRTLHGVTHVPFLVRTNMSVTCMRLKVTEVRRRMYLKSGSCVAAGCLMTSHYCSRHWDPQMEVEALEYRSASAHVTPCRRRRDDLWWWHLVLPHYCTHVGVS
jgi:hypothetical protein